MLIIQTQATFCPEGHRICRRERRARPLADFLDMNPRGRLTTATGKPLKGYYNQCFECVDRGYRYSKGEPQIPLDAHRARSAKEKEAWETMMQETTEINAARRLQHLQNEQIAEATRQTLALAPSFGGHPDPAHDGEADADSKDLWEYPLQGLRSRSSTTEHPRCWSYRHGVLLMSLGIWG